jgi:hypothetical protein
MEMTNASFCVTYPHTVRWTSRWVTSKVINLLSNQHVDDINNEFKGYTIDYNTPSTGIEQGLFFYGNESIDSLKVVGPRILATLNEPGPDGDYNLEVNLNPVSVTVTHGVDLRDAAQIEVFIGYGDSFTLDGSSYISSTSNFYFLDTVPNSNGSVIVNGSVVVDGSSTLTIDELTTLNGNITVRGDSGVTMGATNGHGKIEVDSGSVLFASAMGSGITVELNHATLSLDNVLSFLATIDLDRSSTIRIQSPNLGVALPVKEIFNTQTGVVDLINSVGGIFEQLTLGNHRHQVVYTEITYPTGNIDLSLTRSSNSLPITITHSAGT